MQKLWTLCVAMGEQATILLCKMHKKYTDKLPLLHTWPVGNSGFKNMPKLAQFDVLKDFFDTYEALRRKQKESIKELRNAFAVEGDESEDAQRGLKTNIALVRKKVMKKTGM